MSSPAKLKGSVRAMCGQWKVLLLTVLLLICAMCNRVGFKLAGYSLGKKPFTMIFLTVAGSIPMNAVSYIYMIFTTGGVLPEFRTGRIFYSYWVIASLNIFNGLGIMWANPYVSGYVQCLLNSFAIPLTMLMSAICFKSRFSLLAIGGVMLIVLGVVYVGAGQSQATGTGSSLLWTLVYAAAQLPLAGASVYQEYTFKKSLNMLHYIHYVTLWLMFDLILFVPVNISVGDTASLSTFMEDMQSALSCCQGIGDNCEVTGKAFMLYIIAMNGGTLVQAVLIKLVSATWCVVVLSLATPLTVMAFACPMIVGEHVEPMTSSTLISAALITFGTLVYRLGSIPRKEAVDRQPSPVPSPTSPRKSKDVGVQTALTLGPHRHKPWQLVDLFSRLVEDQDQNSRVPGVVASGVGLFPSEYTDATRNPVSLWEEHTFAEQRRPSKSSAEPLLKEKVELQPDAPEA